MTLNLGSRRPAGSEVRANSESLRISLHRLALYGFSVFSLITLVEPVRSEAPRGGLRVG